MRPLPPIAEVGAEGKDGCRWLPFLSFRPFCFRPPANAGARRRPSGRPDRPPGMKISGTRRKFLGSSDRPPPKRLSGLRFFMRKWSGLHQPENAILYFSSQRFTWIR
ncbi:MAG: hypothetical protein C6W57_04875 [Caldibacillus debilis]|nr:MAG: hypothetical protein C6W57_04875 [Caldibacillus debilis]